MKLRICVYRRGEVPLRGTLWKHCLLRSCRGFMKRFSLMILNSFPEIVLDDIGDVRLE